MFPPIPEFNFVFASLATVAATVGYAFTRTSHKGMGESISIPHSSSSSSEDDSSPMEEKQRTEKPAPVAVFPLNTRLTSPRPTARRGSLKRKVPDDGFDEPTPDIGYPFNLAHIYPNKRCKTPPSPAKEADSTPAAPSRQHPLQLSVAFADEDVEIPHVEPEGRQDDEEARPVRLPELATPQGVSPSTPFADAQTPAPEPPRTPSPPPPSSLPSAAEEPAPAVVPEAPQPTPATPPPVQPAPAQPQSAISGLTPPITRPSTPNAQFGTTLTAPRFGIATPSPFASSSTSSSAFAAFAGSRSPFASVKNQSFGSPSGRRPAFGAFSQNESPSAFGGSGTFGGLLPEQETGEDQSSGKRKEQEHAIDAVEAKEKQVKVTHVTGEEAESVKRDLKGVKLFVKRGNKPFASGMVGHLKLLSDKETSKERLLFRREPLWQVSMNVKVNNAVRFTYEAEENAIRLVLKEPVEGQLANSSKEQQLEVVVYALKPGRACPKQDFKDFAESLMKNAQFSKPEESSRTSA